MSAQLDLVVSVAQAAEFMQSENIVVVDCRFRLSDLEFGQSAYEQSHIAGAVFADLERDLSDMNVQGHGRHPLPDMQALAQKLAQWGIGKTSTVLAYDEAEGMFAARLLWLLKTCGYSNIALIDGGWNAWQKAGLPVSSDCLQRKESPIPNVEIGAQDFLSADSLQTALDKQSCLLLDARGAPRFRGEVEPLDKKAGHVPGARNRPFTENLDSEGRFKSAAVLRAEFTELLQGCDPKSVVHMCGSGVTACHNWLAMERAGLHASKLFADSWSGWISEGSRPIATGDT